MTAEPSPLTNILPLSWHSDCQSVCQIADESKGRGPYKVGGAGPADGVMHSVMTIRQ